MNTSHPEQDYGSAKKSLPIYIVGLLACIVLTLAPYYAVKQVTDNKLHALEIIYICGLIQFVVQLLCFIRLHAKTHQAVMNVMSFLMTLLIIFILVAGSLWIMYSLDYNMMH